MKCHRLNLVIYALLVHFHKSFRYYLKLPFVKLQFYQAKKIADALRVEADAKAYSVKVQAEADAEQTRLVAEAIKADGQPAINFELMKRQVDSIGLLASSNQTKTLVLPTDITKTLGSLEVLIETFRGNNKDG